MQIEEINFIKQVYRMRNKVIVLFSVICTIAIVFFISNIAQAQWIQQYSGFNDDLYGMHFLNDNLGHAVGWGASYGAVVLTTYNGGEDWEGVIPVSGAYLFSVTFIDSLNGFAAGCDAGGSFNAMILKTTDGGENWTRRLFSDSYGFYVVTFPDPSIGYACGWLGAIYKTENGGGSWYRQSSGTSNVFRWMHFPTVDTGYAVCGTNFNNPNTLYKTTNGGDDWNLVHNFGSGTVIGGVYFHDTQNGIVVGHNGREAIMKTIDGGETWEVKHTGTSSAVLQGLDFNGEQGWAVGSYGRIIRTIDSGENWTLDETVSPPVLLLAVYESGNTVCAVGSGGGIYTKDLTTSINPNDDILPSEFILFQNYPNPFNSSTEIRYSIPIQSDVRLDVYNILGRRIATLVDENQQLGDHSVLWDASGFSSGIYFYRITARNESYTKRMTLLK